MSYLYDKSQASIIIVKCVLIMATVFIDSCHQQLDHVHEEEEKD
jgi:hypothetical protein